MKVLGIITEYNPFHNGHLYHIKESVELCKADYTISIMSSNFIQRGEPAIVNKWSRTQMAIEGGVDLVIELPVIYSMSSAEFFSFGAIKLLNSLRVVDNVCFGSETGNIDILDPIAEVLYNEPDKFKVLLKNFLKQGISFPLARQNALKEYLASSSISSENISKIMTSSNNILGIEYLKAIKKLKSPIIPKTILRLDNDYNTEYITGNISSATSIRNYLHTCYPNKNLTYLEKTIPDSTLKILNEEFENGRGPVFSEHFGNILLAFLRRMSLKEIAATPFISEGLENRIQSAALTSGTLKDLIDTASTKRYTRTRIQRSLFNLLVGLTSQEFDLFNQNGGPQYIRVLGFNSKGRQLLSAIKKRATLPLIVKTANYKNHPNYLISRMLEIESLSTDLYVLGYENPSQRNSGQDFTQKLIII